MHGLDIIIRRNNEATERELNDALAAGDLALAFRIADAIIGDALAKGVGGSDEEREVFGEHFYRGRNNA